jgi:uncharacterized protein
MHIWVDADACPGVIKEIVFRAAERKQIATTLVANQFIKVPASKYLSSVQVAAGFDVADNEIVKRLSPGDLVITQDIPLADEVLALGAYAINPRGEAYTQANIKARLNMRDFMDTLRASGVHTGGPAPLNHADRKNFADQLDRLITKLTRPKP